MSKRYHYTVVKVCEWCNQEFTTQKKGQATARFCNNSCAGLWKAAQPGYKEKLSKAQQKPLITKTCEWCGKEFSFRSKGQKSNDKRRFCQNSCAASWRMTQPDRKEQSRKAVKIAQAKNKGSKRPDASKRMKENNPMTNQEAREKVSQALSGRPFPTKRGGNGQIAIPQETLLNALGWTTDKLEWIVKTKPAREHFSNLPDHYKIDIADPLSMTAIEVDGHSHNTRLGKERDKKKEATLNFLGWSVLRFSNKEVMANPQAIAAQIMSTISK